MATVESSTDSLSTPGTTAPSESDPMRFESVPSATSSIASFDPVKFDFGSPATPAVQSEPGSAATSATGNSKKRKRNKLASGNSGKSSGKPLLDAQVPTLDAVSLIPLVLELGTMEILRLLHQSVHGSEADGTDASAVADVITIVCRQESLVADLRKMIADAAGVVPARRLNVCAVFDFVVRLQSENSSIFEYVPRLPGNICSQVLTLDNNLLDLRERCVSALCSREYPGPPPEE